MTTVQHCFLVAKIDPRRCVDSCTDWLADGWVQRGATQKCNVTHIHRRHTCVKKKPLTQNTAGCPTSTHSWKKATRASTSCNKEASGQ